MTDVSASADSQKEDAKLRCRLSPTAWGAEAKSADELEKLREDMQKQIDEAYKRLRALTAMPQKSAGAWRLHSGYAYLTWYAKWKRHWQAVYFSKWWGYYDRDPWWRHLRQAHISFEGLGAADGEVMLAAVVYDGDAVLYRNMRIVENAVQAVSDKYENVYFTYINTSK